jgi:hypothetical protein
MNVSSQAPAGVPHVPADTPTAVRRRLWFSLLAGPLAWTVHELVGVALIGRTCELGTGFPAWRWAALVAVGVAALLVTSAAAVTAFSTFRSRVGHANVFTATSRDSVEFLARFALFVSLFLLFNIVLFGAAPLAVDPCVGGTV